MEDEEASILAAAGRKITRGSRYLQHARIARSGPRIGSDSSPGSSVRSTTASLRHCTIGESNGVKFAGWHSREMRHALIQFST